MTKMNELKDNEIGMDFLVELVSQAIVSFPPLKDETDYPDTDELITDAVQKGLIDLSKFKPAYMNYSGAAENEDGSWDEGLDEWQDIWPFDVNKQKRVVLKVNPDSKPARKKKTRLLTVEVEAPKEYTDEEIKEELQMRLMCVDGEQHLETMNWDIDPKIKFKVK